jgi:DNA-binding NarL/FixJ family response regulator
MNSENLIKIVIVGDYSIFRTGLKMLIETEKRFRVVGETSNFEEASDLMSHEDVDVVLFDLPESNGSELVSSIPQSLVNTPILILTASKELELYQKCLRLGASGLVPKEKNAEILFKAIEKVHQGEFWFDRLVMGQTIRQLVDEKHLQYENPQVNAHASLTEREKEVLNLICKGLKNKGIAERLFITETTVRHHLTSIFEKLEVSSRLELVIYAFKHSLVSMPVKIQAN